MSGTNPLSSNANLAATTATQADSTLSGGLPAANETAATDRKADRIELAIRVLERSEVDQATSLFAASPGWKNDAEAFRSDAIRFFDSPPSAIIGAYLRDGTLVGVGCAVKELFDFAYWSITWVMVDESLRGQGVGAKVVRGIEDYMLKAQDEYNNPNTRVLLSAVDEGAATFYTRLGYTELLKGPLDGDGECLMYRELRGPGLPPKSENRK